MLGRLDSLVRRTSANATPAAAVLLVSIGQRGSARAKCVFSKSMEGALCVCVSRATRARDH
eukprot:6018581-Prymnesium_polylepis.2